MGWRLPLAYSFHSVLTDILEPGHFSHEEWRLRGGQFSCPKLKVSESQSLDWMESRSYLLLHSCAFFSLPLVSLVNFFI